jgi:hypothetical protein
MNRGELDKKQTPKEAIRDGGLLCGPVQPDGFEPRQKNIFRRL